MAQLSFHTNTEAVLTFAILELKHHRHAPAHIGHACTTVVFGRIFPWSTEQFSVFINLKDSIVLCAVAVPAQADARLQAHRARSIPVLDSSEIEAKLKAMRHLLLKPLGIAYARVSEINVLRSEVGIVMAARPLMASISIGRYAEEIQIPHSIGARHHIVIDHS